MELSSSFLLPHKPLHSSSYSHNLLRITTKTRHPTTQILRISAVAIDPPPQELPQNSPRRLLQELAERKRPSPKRRAPPRRFVLTPPVNDKKLANRLLNSPQLTLNNFPVLSSCLPYAKLNDNDNAWMEEHLMEAKQALGYPLEPSEEVMMGEGNPAKMLDTLLYLAFQHPKCERSRARHVRCAHSRLVFLGQYVLELALAEFFLQRYPRESPGPMRERVFGLIGKRSLPMWIKAASLQNLIFPNVNMDKLVRKDREPIVK